METEISMLQDALEYEIRLIAHADDPVELTFDACIAMKNLHRLFNLKREQLEKKGVTYDAATIYRLRNCTG